MRPCGTRGWVYKGEVLGQFPLFPSHYFINANTNIQCTGMHIALLKVEHAVADNYGSIIKTLYHLVLSRNCISSCLFGFWGMGGATRRKATRLQILLCSQRCGRELESGKMKVVHQQRLFWLHRVNSPSILHHKCNWISLGRTGPELLLHNLFEPSYTVGKDLKHQFAGMSSKRSKGKHSNSWAPIKPPKLITSSFSLFPSITHWFVQFRSTRQVQMR